jgi:hypothetical protein
VGSNPVLDEEWQLLASFLPQNWRELAHETGAIRRQRGITDPATLLRLLFLHVASGLSLRQAVARAKVLGWPSMSDVALLKRLRTSERWLGALASKMYLTSRFGDRARVPATTRRIRAIDATTVEEPGATGTNWRVHYSIVLPEVMCDFYEITDVTGGESYKRFPIQKGDILLADRGYSHREGAAQVVRAGGDVVVRLNSSNFPLIIGSGKAFEVLPHLRRLKRQTPDEWEVFFQAGSRRFAARLCAVRKSKTAAEAAKKRVIHEASRKGKVVQAATLESAEYVVVLTTLAKQELTTIDVLDLYRMRWQIELVFKRLKSLLKLGHVPKINDSSARAWIQAKILTALLIERLSTEARFFSPWGFDISTLPLPMA